MRVVLVALIVAWMSDAAAAPCFPERRTVRFDGELWDLQGWYDDDGKRAGPKGTWGRCTVDKGVVREADGTTVAYVYCGATVKVAGLVDDHGVGVGMRGEAVLEAHGDGPSSKLICAGTYERKARRVQCWIPAGGKTSEWTWRYVVKGRLPATSAEEGWLVRGERALAFFRRRKVVELWHHDACNH